MRLQFLLLIGGWLIALVAACGDGQTSSPVVRGHASQTTNDVGSLRRYAQCMRDHGVDDWPDPDGSGTFHLAPTLWANLKSGPRWPGIETAWQACRHHLPTGHISTVAA